jgi:hypothetical protein
MDDALHLGVTFEVETGAADGVDRAREHARTILGQRHREVGGGLDVEAHRRIAE